MSRFLRAAAAALAVAAYALPPTLGLVADLGHGAHHLVDELQQHRRLAAELGLVHGGERRVSRRPDVPAAGGRVVHSHGGAAHSHDAATDALLVAAAKADEDAGERHAPSSVQLSIHVPAETVSLLPGPTPTWPPEVLTAEVVGVASLTPIPPPPRA